jgi:hypothetical protein
MNMLAVSVVASLILILPIFSSSSVSLLMILSFVVMTLSISPWLRYFAAIPLLGLTGHFSTSPARFVYWAQHAGFLSSNGNTLRFRHREFQAWLSKQLRAPEISTDLIVERRLN